MEVLSEMQGIYNINSESQISNAGCELRQNDIEKKFIDSVANMICGILSVNYNERRITNALIVTAIKDKFDTRHKHQGLLQQYGAYILDMATKRMIKELDLPEDIKVNHSYAAHAKLADIIDAIEEKIKKVNK